MSARHVISAWLLVFGLVGPALAAPEQETAALSKQAAEAYLTKNYADAAALYQKALASVVPSAPAEIRRALLTNLGASLAAQGKHSKAVPLYEEALALAKKAGNGRGAADTARRAVHSLKRLGETKKASDVEMMYLMHRVDPGDIAQRHDRQQEPSDMEVKSSIEKMLAEHYNSILETDKDNAYTIGRPDITKLPGGRYKAVVSVTKTVRATGTRTITQNERICKYDPLR